MAWSFYSANREELLNGNVILCGSFDSFNEARTGGSAPSAKVINVQMLDAMSFPNKDIIELNMYFCVIVKRASGALTIKHTASMHETPSSSWE